MARAATTKSPVKAVQKAAAPVEESADERLIEQSLERITRITRKATVEMVVEVGDYLVKGYFGGSLEAARSRSPRKPESLSALLSRVGDVDAERGMVRRSIGLSVQYRDLPSSLASRLSLRQHYALLTIPEIEAKVRYGSRALDERLNGVALGQLIRAERGPAAKGRPPRSALDKALRAAKRALLAAEIEAELPIAKLRAVDAEALSRHARDVHALRERLERIGDALGKVGR